LNRAKAYDVWIGTTIFGTTVAWNVVIAGTLTQLLADIGWLNANFSSVIDNRQVRDNATLARRPNEIMSRVLQTTIFYSISLVDHVHARRYSI